MHLFRAAALLAATLCLGGGIADGWYVIRVRVTAEDEGTAIFGATVAARSGPRASPQRPAATAIDGTYEVRYWFGGMGFLFYSPGPGDPHVAFTAPGYQSRVVRLRAGDDEAGVRRGPRGSKHEGWCFVLDVVLTPDPAPPATAAPPRS